MVAKKKPTEPQKPTLDQIKDAIKTRLDLFWNEDGKLDVRVGSLDLRKTMPGSVHSLSLEKSSQQLSLYDLD